MSEADKKDKREISDCKFINNWIEIFRVPKANSLPLHLCYAKHSLEQFKDISLFTAVIYLAITILVFTAQILSSGMQTKLKLPHSVYVLLESLRS